MSDNEIVIRPMSENDLVFVSEIELLSGLNKWGNDCYRADLKKKEVLLFVAIFDEKLCGYIYARLITPEVEIFNIAVLPDFRNRGVGKKLLENVLKTAAENGCRNCWLEVRESNETARKFYERLDFKSVGRRRNYYNFPTEDALLLEYKIKTEPCLDERFEL